MATVSPPWERDDVRVVLNGPHRSNSYLLRAADGVHCVVIDPGLDREAMTAALAACGWQPLAVLCTHGHFDHVGGAAWLQATYGLPVLLHEADFRLAQMSNFLMAAFRMPQRIELPEFSPIGEDGASHDLGGLTLRCHALPGHTPGSVGILAGDLLFSGDSLYARHTALSKLPGEDHARLRASLTNLFAWIPPGVRVLPGHGGSASIAEILAHNEPLRRFMADTSALPCEAS